MSIMTVKILTENGEKTPIQIDTQSGQPVHITAESGEQFQLVDGNTNFGPENIAVARQGDDLVIAFEGSDLQNPNLIIDGYYTTAGSNGTNNLIVGLHENGHIYPYIPETASQVDAIGNLANGATANEALGGEISTVAAFIPPAVPLWAWGALGLLAIGGIAAAAGGSGGSDDTPAPANNAILNLTGPDSVNEGVGDATYTATLTKAVSTDTVVTYTITNGSTEDADFTQTTGTVTIKAGETSAPIPVGIAQDNVFENSENYTVTISATASGVSAGTVTKTTTIWDNGTTDGTTPVAPTAAGNAGGTDNDTPEVTLTGPDNVNEGVGTVKYTVTLDKISTQDTVVTYTITDGTTEAGDVTAVTGAASTRTGSVTIKAGQKTADIEVYIAQDDVYEKSEKYTITIDKPANAKLGTASVDTTIWDNGTIDGNIPAAPQAQGNKAGTDSDLPQISIGNNPTVNEGAGTVTYTVTIDKISDFATTATYTVSNGSTNADDFGGTMPAGTVTIAKGAKSGVITIPLAHNTPYEGPETYTVTLSNPVNGEIAKASTQTTIYDNGTTDGKASTYDPSNADDRVIDVQDDSETVVEGNTVTGSFVIDASEQPAKISVNGKDFTVNQLMNSTPLNAGDTGEGTITITGYRWDSAAKQATVDYSYTAKVLTHTNGADISDVIAVQAFKDYSDTPVDGTITIAVKDTAPAATNDSASLNEGATKTGSVLTNDTASADGSTTVSTVQNSAITGSSATVTGKYGELTINTDGSYTYKETASLKVDEKVTDTFTYTIKDADGSTSTANLTFDITGVNDAPIPVNGADVNITENATADGAEVATILATDNDGPDPVIYQDFAVTDSNGTVQTGATTLTAKDGTTYTVTPEKDGWTIKNEVSGAEGKFTVNTATGKVTLTGNDSGVSVFDTLPAGETLEIPLNFKAADGKAASGYGSQKFVITGVNDKGTINDQAINGINLSLKKTTGEKTNIIGDKDSGQAFINALSLDYNNGTITKTALDSDGAATVIQSRYGSYDAQMEVVSDYKYNNFNWTFSLNSSNAAVKAIEVLGKNTLTITDYLNFTTLDNAAHIEDSSEQNVQVAISTSGVQNASAYDNAGSISADRQASHDILKADSITGSTVTMEGNDDVAVVSGDVKRSTISLGDGDDYFYATDASTSSISDSTFEGGAGNDLFSFANNTTFTGKNIIKGGGGTDTLILGGSAEIKDSALSITGIEIIDTRYANSDNQITISAEAIAKNGVKDVYLLGGDTGDTVKLTGFQDAGNGVYTYTDNTGTYTLHDELNLGQNGFIV